MDANTRLFTKEGKFWDLGTQLLRYQNARFPLNAPLATDNMRVMVKTKTGQVYEREIPIVALETELERLRSTFPEVQIVSEDPIRSPLAFSLAGKTINPTYAFGLASEILMPFPTRGIAGGVRVARGLTRFSDEFGFFARRAFAPLSEGAKLAQRAEALAELAFLPSYTAGALPFGLASRLLGKAGVRMPQINIGAGGRFAGLMHTLNKANEFFFAQHFIPFELSSGYNATMHRLWDKVMKEAREAGVNVAERGKVNADLAHFLNAPAEEVMARMLGQADEYHPLLQHILRREGITAEKVVSDLFSARRAIFSKYGDEMSLIAHNLHRSELKLSIGRGLARANLAVGDAIQRMSTRGITKWLYPAWSFQDTVHHLTSFGTTLATAMQGRLQVMERTGAELIRGLTGDPAFKSSALYQAHKELSELRDLIRTQYGDLNSPLAQKLASLHIDDIDEALKAGERFITKTGILPDTPIYARLFAKDNDGVPVLQRVLDEWRRANAELAETGKTLTPEQAWDAVPKSLRDETKLLKSEAEALYRWFEDTEPAEQVLATAILGRGADLTDDLGKYFLKAKELRGLGFTPQALDELVDHYGKLEEKIGLSPEQRLKFQGLLYRLLQNKIFSPDELVEARRFLQDIGVPAEQIDDMLSAFQAGQSLIRAQDIAFGYTSFEISRFLNRLREARAKWEEAFFKTAQETFPDCVP
jgi:DNA-binding transcriptional MerR regulator